jgi:plastocyanin
MRRMMRAVRLIVAAAALFIVGATSADAMPNAAAFTVNIQGFAFNPVSRTINVGDSVTWTNLDQAVHSAKANNGSFDTGFLTTDQSKGITFTTAGTFGYICGVHGASMSGTIVVVAAATPEPTPPPTPQPTPPPTAQPTAPPTPRPPTPPPTPLPTPQPTEKPTEVPTPSPTTPAPSVVASATPTPTPSVVAAQPTPARATAAPATVNDSGPSVLLIAGAAIVIAGLIGIAVMLSRR